MAKMTASKVDNVVGCDCITHFVPVDDGSVLLLGDREIAHAKKENDDILDYIHPFFFCSLCGRKLEIDMQMN